ncbi:RHS repeat-associated core domain-containing protein [Leptospira licerasiae]|nr:RHS repeat-associated core domain-containing protein [Leptospira licerasiae]
MSYDSSGNMTYQRDNFKDLTKTITVDSQNRITQVQDALSTTIGNYWYDEGGFRVRKKALVPSGVSFKNQEILYPSKFYGLEYSEETNILSSINNVYLNGVRIAALNEDGVTAYFLTDQVDSVAHVLDEGAHTLSRMQYEPYGETLVQRGTLDFAPKYNSKELDRETNFYFYNARYYDPQIARFTSADSVIDGARSTQGWNRFSYVAGNPIRYKDPTGHDRVDYAEGILEESTNLLRNSVKSTAYTALLGPAGLPIQSTIGMIDVLSNPKEAFNQITEKYRNLASEDEHVRDNAAGKVTVATTELAFNAIALKKIGTSGINTKNNKAFVIGEGMDDIKIAAKELQAMGINAKWYQAWKKNFPKDSAGNAIPMTDQQIAAAQKRNARIINEKIKQEYKIYDIGPDGRTKSPFYRDTEVRIIKEKSYPTTPYPRPQK